MFNGRYILVGKIVYIYKEKNPDVDAYPKEPQVADPCSIITILNTNEHFTILFAFRLVGIRCIQYVTVRSVSIKC